MKINSLLIILVVPLFMFCQGAKPETESVKKIEEIQVLTVDFSIFSIISIDCDRFEKTFSDIIISKSITDTTVVNEFLSQKDKLVPLDSTLSKQVDTRTKIHLISEIDTTTICVGHFKLQMNDRFYHTPQFIIDFLEEIKKRDESEETSISSRNL